MAECDGASSWVQLFLGNTELLDAVSSLARKGFIDLKNVNVVDLEAGILEGCWDGQSGTNTHDVRRHSSNSKADNSAVDLASEFLCHISASQEDTRSTIGDLAGIASSG